MARQATSLVVRDLSSFTRSLSRALAEQTEQTFNNIETVLEAAGASLDDVVSCLVHLVDLAVGIDARVVLADPRAIEE